MPKRMEIIIRFMQSSVKIFLRTRATDHGNLDRVTRPERHKLLGITRMAKQTVRCSRATRQSLQANAWTEARLW